MRGRPPKSQFSYVMNVKYEMWVKMKTFFPVVCVKYDLWAKVNTFFLVACVKYDLWAKVKTFFLAVCVESISGSQCLRMSSLLPL